MTAHEFIYLRTELQVTESINPCQFFHLFIVNTLNSPE